MARKSAIPIQPVQHKVNTTDDLPEGLNNKYYTKALMRSKIDTFVDSDFLENLSNFRGGLLGGQPRAYYQRIIEDKDGNKLN
jgi:hypothetical protein